LTSKVESFAARATILGEDGFKLRDVPTDGSRGHGTSRETVSLAIRSGALGSLATLAFNLFILPFVLKQLGENLYGAWIALAALVAVGSLADAGIRTEVARRTASGYGEGDTDAMYRAAKMGTTVMCLTVAPILLIGIALTPVLSHLILPEGVPGYRDVEVNSLLRVMLSAMAINLVLSAFFAVLRGIQRSDVEVLGQVLGLPAQGATLIVGITVGWGLWALVWAQCAGMGVSLAFQAVGLRRLAPWLRLRIGRTSLASIGSYLSLSGLALISQIGDIFDSQWDKLVISRYVDSVSVTAFHVGTMLVLQSKAVALLPMAPLLAGIAELRVKRQAEARALQTQLMKAGSVTGSVILGVVFTFAPSFIVLWLGEDYAAAGTVARIFVVAVGLNLLSAPIAFQAFAEGAHRVAAGAALMNIVVNAVASLVLTIQVGLYGALIGSVIGNLVGTSVFLVVAKRRLSTWVAPPVLAPVFTIVVVSGLVLTGVDSIRSVPLLAVAGVLVTSILALGCARAERQSLRTIIAIIGRWDR
jgi:O-antigen/teichoic acid export membrane protein